MSLKDGRGGVEVTLEIRNLPEPGIEHINHIHTSGTCADDQAGRPAPVTIPLTTIAAQKDGTGSATTIIKGASAAQPFDHNKEGFILLQAKAHVIAVGSANERPPDPPSLKEWLGSPMQRVSGWVSSQLKPVVTG